MTEEKIETELKEDKKSGKPAEKIERRLVIPGEVIVVSDESLPGDYTRKEGNEIIAERFGLVEGGERVVRVIPVSGVFDPRRGNNVIGIVEDITFNGWVINVGGPYGAFLPLAECPRYIDKNEIADFAGVGDAFNVKIFGVRKNGSIDLTLKSRGLGKLEGGKIIKINPHKVPRVIGKEGSMINLIKDNTGTDITVGQNGRIWIKGNDEGENRAEEAIKLIERESGSSGLTDKVEDFLNK